MNYHRFIRPLVACAPRVAVALVLAGGCGSSADSDSALGNPGDSSSGGGSGFDGSFAPDAGPGGGTSLDANACQPGDISEFKPVWKPPTPFHQGACGIDPARNQPMWQSFREACLGSSGSKAECAKFTQTTSTQNAAYYKCGQCIATPDTADHYGPLIVHMGWVEPNIPGCLANAMHDPTGVNCASSVQAARECEIAACGANCPVTSEATLTLFDGCTQSADDMLCKSYVDPANTCLDPLADAGGDVGKCVESANFDIRFDDIVEMFCGGPMDAGKLAD